MMDTVLDVIMFSSIILFIIIGLLLIRHFYGILTYGVKSEIRRTKRMQRMRKAGGSRTCRRRRSVL